MDNSTTTSSEPVSQPRLPAAIEILSQALAVYQKQKVTIWGIMIIPSLISFAVNVFVPTTIYNLKEALSPFDWTKMWRFLFMFLTLGLIILISQIWSQIALIYAVKDEQEKIGTIEAYRRGRTKILPYFWVSILAGIITSIGFILLVIPGIIFLIWFSLALYVLIGEDLRGMKVLSKSREYVQGYWWSVFWRFLFLIAFLAILALIISFVLNFLKPFGDWIMKVITDLFFLPLATIYGFLIYSHLKSLKG